MKKNFYLLIVLISINTFSQSKNSTGFSTNETHVEIYPIYKGCEKEKDKQKCFLKKITSHFSNKFKANHLSNTSPGLKRAFIIFRINEIGEIDSVKIRTSHPKIELEAKRVLQLIPKVIPATTNNKPVAVKFCLPLVVNIEKKKSNFTRKAPWQKSKTRKF